jgi:hypothetical protein
MCLFPDPSTVTRDDGSPRPARARQRFRTPRGHAHTARGPLAPSLILAAAALSPPLGTHASPIPVDWPESAYNPAPLKADLILPIPCGGAMAFRAVQAEAKGPLDDLEVELGSDDPAQGYAEHRRPAYVAGSFRGAEGAGGDLIIGKYEVSELQFRSVLSHALGTPCPRPGEGPPRAQVSVSWHEAIRFSDAYSQWLAEHASKIPPCSADAAPCLPREDGVPAFVRLPTEVEWEYAARGGARVSPSEFRTDTHPMPEGIEYYAWFNENADGEIKPIGLRKPNPLGLHDMLGNAEEMMLEPFRLRRLDRDHGQVGAIVVRGGSIRADRAELRASLRREVPHYGADGAVKTDDTGFRVVASVPVFTSSARLQEVRAAWHRLGTDNNNADPNPPPGAPAQVIDLREPPHADPVLELLALAEGAADAALKARLERLRRLVAADRQKLYEQRGRSARETLRFGGLTCLKLHDEGHNMDLLRASLKICSDSHGPDYPRCAKRSERVAEDDRVLRENIRFHADSVVRTAENYAQDMDVLETELEGLVASLRERGYEALRIYPRTFLHQVRDYAAGGAVKTDAWFAQCKGLK